MIAMQRKNYSIKLIPGDYGSITDLMERGVSLDGFVQGPQQGPGDRWSFDHHDHCIRLVTLSTCEQVRNVLCLGGAGWLNDRVVYVNDLDGDTVMSLWLMDNAHKANEDRVRSLVRAVGAIDAHGPAGALLLSKEENSMASLFFRAAIKPVTDLRGKVREVFGQWPELLEQCFQGITSLIEGTVTLGTTPPVVLDYYRLAVTINGHKFAIATCEGFGFSALYEDGYDGGILFQDAADGTRTYTVAKRSDLVNLAIGPVSRPGSLLAALAALEPGWGGGSSIGGSPRLEGGKSSSLTPDQVWEIACTTLKG
jgi:hypothetical protein